MNDTFSTPVQQPSIASGETSTPAPQPTPPMSVRERLQAQRDQMGGHKQTTLPVSGMVATFPAFINHGAILAASKQAGKDKARVGAVLIAQHVTIEGERLAVADVTDLMHNDDVIHLTDLLLGSGGDKKDGTGN